MIQYALPRQGLVTLDIYNLLGQKIRRLVNETQVGGRYSVAWNGQNEKGEIVSSGVYLYLLHVETQGEGTFHLTGKMILIR